MIHLKRFGYGLLFAGVLGLMIAVSYLSDCFPIISMILIVSALIYCVGALIHSFKEY